MKFVSLVDIFKTRLGKRVSVFDAKNENPKIRLIQCRVLLRLEFS